METMIPLDPPDDCPFPAQFPFSASDGEKVAEGRMRCFYDGRVLSTSVIFL
jgi:hypothetical protein